MHVCLPMYIHTYVYVYIYKPLCVCVHLCCAGPAFLTGIIIGSSNSTPLTARHSPPLRTSFGVHQFTVAHSQFVSQPVGFAVLQHVVSVFQFVSQVKRLVVGAFCRTHIVNRVLFCHILEILFRLFVTDRRFKIRAPKYKSLRLILSRLQNKNI